MKQTSTAAAPCETNQQTPIIQVRNLRKEYHMGGETVVALHKINLSIERGEICCIFGTSGSGKSTLLNQLAGLEKPTRGDILIDGVSVPSLKEDQLAAFRQQNLGFIFQSYNLLSSLTATENVAMPLLFRGVEKRIRNQAAEAMLKRVGLSHRLHHYPNQMSGGQQQRAGIARAFVARPKIVFADEPTGNLDSKTTKEIMKMVLEFSHQYGLTMILVTHDPNLAQYANRVITLMDGTITSDKKETTP